MLLKLLAWLLLIGLAIALCSGLWIAGSEIRNLYLSSDSTVRLAILTASGSALAFILNNAIQSSRERKSRHFEAKSQVYQDFFDVLFEMIESQGNAENQDAYLEKFQEFKKGVMVWGSRATIKALNKFTVESTVNPDPEMKVVFLRMELLLRELRKDLGHNDVSLERFALIKIFLRADDHDKLD